MQDLPAAVGEADLTAIYRAPLSEFIGRRNQAVKRLKAAGEGESADWLRRLTKPAVTAWALNQLFFEHTAEFAELLAAGGAVWQAQRDGTPEDHRQATERRGEAVLELVELANQVLLSAGHNAGLSANKRMARTLESLSIYGPERSPEPPGRLSRDLDPPGLDELLGLAAAAGASLGSIGPKKRGSRIPASAPKSSTKAKGVRPSNREREQLARQVGRLEREAKAKRSMASQMTAERKRAESAQQSALRGVDKATERLEVAKRKAKEAAEAMGVAEKSERRAELVALTAEKELEALERELARLSST